MPVQAITKAGKKRLRWTFERVIGGQRIRKTKVFPAGTSQADADKIAAKWEAEIYAVAEGAKKRRTTIGQCVELHFRDKGTGWKDGPKRARILEKWRDLYDERYTDELHQWSLDFSAKLAGEGLSPASVRNVLAYIRAAVKYAYKVGLAEEDQTKRLVIPAVKNERHVYPQRRDMLRVAWACEDRQVRAAIRIAFYSGMRRSEILRAKVTKAGFSLADTKNGKPRIVPIHPRIAVLARRVKFTIDGDRFSGQWEKARKAAGLPHVRFHDLRHGAASEMINRGVDLYTVGGVLGHKSVVSTKRYSHLLTDRLADAIGKIGGKR
ncbi:site-specific integrase [Cupriavidus gilardii]|uniref:Site-specific integrase n=1 Tax=Cupriavidus gilardii TaxID=82541 RepID=A0ABY4VQL0_9BURK|nr:site-specific integrase [Cupriavidus gilardii]USE79531.1 site-specific integrase [Cupriavidus gilardii]